jgi:branched-chain amino acid transport system permease protein
MELFLQQLLNGLTIGGVYCLVALGLTMVYGILNVPNFAHGAFYMVGAYCGFYMTTRLGANYWVAMFCAAVIVGSIAILSERLIFAPLKDKNAPELHDMIASIGVLLFLESAVQVIFGSDFHRLQSPYGQLVEIFGVISPLQRLLIIAAAFGLMFLLHLFLQHTFIGLTIIASSQNTTGAALVGIDSVKVRIIVFGLSGVLAAIAAVLYAPINLVYPSMGNLVITKAFVIIILGGMGSFPGAIMGGLIIGLAESFGAFYVSTDYKDLIAFALLVFILSYRPQGIFNIKGGQI